MAVQEPVQAQPSYNDEIDLVELMALVWRQRTWMVGGLGAGAVLASLYFAASTRAFKSTIPMTLDASSLPALTDTAKVQAAFDSALGTRENATQFFDQVLKVFPKYEDEKWRKDTIFALVNSQVPAEAGKKRSGKFGVKVAYVAGQGDYAAEVVLPLEGSSDSLGMAVVKGINAVADSYNKTNVALRINEAKSTLKESMEALQQEQLKRTPNVDSASEDQMKVRGEISAMVAKLQKRAPGMAQRDGNLFAPMMFTSQGASKEGSVGYAMVQPDYVEERLDVLRASRLIGVLQDNGNLSRKDASELEGKLAELSRKSIDLEADSRAQAGMRQTLLERIAQAKLRMSVTKSEEDLPLMRGDAPVLRDMHERGMLELRSPGLKLLLLGGAFLGLFGGLFLGLGVSFVRHNLSRLTALAAEKVGAK